MLKRSSLLCLVAAALLILPVAASAQAPLVREGCLGCHGANGAGASGVPGLAGRDAQELRALMSAYRANERPATIMNRIVRGYTDEELAAAADYFSKLR